MLAAAGFRPGRVGFLCGSALRVQGAQFTPLQTLFRDGSISPSGGHYSQLERVAVFASNGLFLSLTWGRLGREAPLD